MVFIKLYRQFFFKINQRNLFRAFLTNLNISKVQSSQKVAPRVFLLLPYCKEMLRLLKKLHFQYSNLNDSESIQICKLLVESKKCYVLHRIDVVEISTAFPFRLKPDAKLHGQRITFVRLFSLLRQKLNAFIGDRQKKWKNLMNCLNVS